MDMTFYRKESSPSSVVNDHRLLNKSEQRSDRYNAYNESYEYNNSQYDQHHRGILSDVTPVYNNNQDNRNPVYSYPHSNSHSHSYAHSPPSQDLHPHSSYPYPYPYPYSDSDPYSHSHSHSYSHQRTGYYDER